MLLLIIIERRQMLNSPKMVIRSLREKMLTRLDIVSATYEVVANKKRKLHYEHDVSLK